MLHYFVIALIYILGIVTCWAYIDRENVQKRTAKIEKEIRELKIKIESEMYKDKIILDKRVDDAEV
jgi:hypothetical protein